VFPPVSVPDPPSVDRGRLFGLPAGGVGLQPAVARVDERRVRGPHRFLLLEPERHVEHGRRVLPLCAARTVLGRLALDWFELLRVEFGKPGDAVVVPGRRSGVEWHLHLEMVPPRVHGGGHRLPVEQRRLAVEVEDVVDRRTEVAEPVAPVGPGSGPGVDADSDGR